MESLHLSYWNFILNHRRILAFGFIHEFCSAPGQTFCIALFVASFGVTFGSSPAELGSVYLAATLGAAFGLSQIGARIDRIGLRTYSLGAAVLLTWACVLTAAAPNLWVLGFGLFALRLSGQGLLVHIETTTTARAFTTDRGRALGLTALGIPLAQALFPPLAVVLIAAIGWRWSYASIGFVVFGLLLACAVWLIPSVNQNEGQIQAAPGAGPHSPNKGASRKLLGSGYFWAAVPMLVVVSFVSTALLFQLTVIAADRGWSSAWVAAGFPVLAVAQVAALFGSGRIIDRHSARWVAVLHAVPITLAVLILAMFKQPFALLGAMFGIGLSNGAARTSFSAVWAEIYGTRHLGAIRGVVMSVMVVASAVAPLVLGLVFSAISNMSNGLMVLAGVAVALQLPLCGVELMHRYERKVAEAEANRSA
jgi:MFS family permease